MGEVRSDEELQTETRARFVLGPHRTGQHVPRGMGDPCGQVSG